VPCVGQWSAWSACADAAQTRQFSVLREASYGGEACAHGDGETASRPCQIVDWKYYTPDSVDGAVWNASAIDRRPVPNATELPMVVCPSGSVVEFRWIDGGGGMQHDVWELPSDTALTNCAFDGSAFELAPASGGGAHTVLCDADKGGLRERYFACAVGGACAKGFQRVRVRVVDPTKTAALVAAGKPTLSSVFADDLITLAYNGHHVGSEDEAIRILRDLESIAENAPQSCADWIPAAQNTEAACQAYVATDMGFMERVRPVPNFTAAASHYARAIELQPTWCGAQAYRAELMLAEKAAVVAVAEAGGAGEFGEARAAAAAAAGAAAAAEVVSQYREACKVCAGTGGLTVVQLEFARRNEEIPSCEEGEDGGSTRTSQGGAGTLRGEVKNGTLPNATDLLGLMQEDLSDGSEGCKSVLPLARAVVAMGGLVGLLW
jgi:hypothetical protein